MLEQLDEVVIVCTLGPKKIQKKMMAATTVTFNTPLPHVYHVTASFHSTTDLGTLPTTETATSSITQ